MVRTSGRSAASSAGEVAEPRGESRGMHAGFLLRRGLPPSAARSGAPGPGRDWPLTRRLGRGWGCAVPAVGVPPSGG